MGAWYFKQPNGKYGRFSTIVDTVTDYNMSKDELYQEMVDRFGKYDYDVEHFEEFVSAKPGTRGYYVHNFEDVISDITDSNETTDSARELLINMGMSSEEAEKYYFMEFPKDAEDDDPIWDVWTPCLVKNE